jgi:hypothetical protein
MELVEEIRSKVMSKSEHIFREGEWGGDIIANCDKKFLKITVEWEE